jgi:hypothetical protein
MDLLIVLPRGWGMLLAEKNVFGFLRWFVVCWNVYGFCGEKVKATEGSL